MALDHIEKRARRIRERRTELRLTQEEVADRMQTAHAERFPDNPTDRTRGQMVSDWERAVNEPSPAKLELLAAALETTVADLSAGPLDERAAPAETPDLQEVLNGETANAGALQQALTRLIESADKVDATRKRLEQMPTAEDADIVGRLDRIEQAVYRIESVLTAASLLDDPEQETEESEPAGDADVLPFSGELGRRAQGSPPNSEHPKRDENQEGEDERRDRR